MSAKLWVVIYIAGEIGGSVGPVPYGINECRKRTAEQMAMTDKTITTPGGYTAEDVRLVCEFRDARPDISPNAGTGKKSTPSQPDSGER